MFEVICINNHGIEDSFDRDIEYMAEVHEDFKVMIWVHDKFGKRREVYRERFKTIKTVVGKIRRNTNDGES